MPHLPLRVGVAPQKSIVPPPCTEVTSLMFWRLKTLKASIAISSLKRSEKMDGSGEAEVEGI
jgi:hypothetical protein